MRELYEKYYKVRLIDNNDPHFQVKVKNFDIEFDTAEEAYAYGEKVRPDNWWDIIIIDCYKLAERK